MPPSPSSCILAMRGNNAVMKMVGTNSSEANSSSVDLLLPMDSSEPVPATRLSASTRSQSRASEFGSPTTLDMEMTSPMPVDLEPPRRYERSVPPDLSVNSDFLDLPELPTGPGKLPPTDKG